jgi:hypothetical protein
MQINGCDKIHGTIPTFASRDLRNNMRTSGRTVVNLLGGGYLFGRRLFYDHCQYLDYTASDCRMMED